jgi:hypothetical protein
MQRLGFPISKENVRLLSEKYISMQITEAKVTLQHLVHIEYHNLHFIDPGA